jgi:hypothetical protein
MIPISPILQKCVYAFGCFILRLNFLMHSIICPTFAVFQIKSKIVGLLSPHKICNLQITNAES